MRSCDGCMVCCEVLSIESLGKEKHCRCEYQANGCGIYERRPLECVAFRCAWLDGLLPEEMRPDRIDAMVVGLGEDKDGIGIHARAPAMQDQRLLSLIAHCRTRGVQVLVGVRP